MGGDAIWDAVSDHLGVGHDETTADGKITLERVECNAACDYAPGRHGQLGVLRQPDHRVDQGARRRPARRQVGQADPRRRHRGDLQGGLAGPGGVRRRARRRGRGRGGSVPDRPAAGPPARLDRPGEQGPTDGEVAPDADDDAPDGAGPASSADSTANEPDEHPADATAATARERQPTAPTAPRRRVGPRERPADPDPHQVLGRPGVLDDGHLRGQRGLPGAQARRRHDPGRARRHGQGLGPARPWRRRLPHRHEVVASCRRRTAARATSSSTPTSPSRAPARTSR